MKQSEEARRLGELRNRPDEQAAYAVTLLKPKFGLEAVKAAVSVLERHPAPQARNDLRSLYWHYAEHNGTRDPGAYTRTAILKALRQVMGRDDVELVVHAVNTYHFLPPAFTEEAAILRSTAVVLLVELDDELAKYSAARLLADGYTEPMSGQPALTAVKVLAVLGEYLSLYQYAVTPGGSHSEVLSECLRNLGEAPDAVVCQLVEQYGDTEDGAAQAGLFDMLLSGTKAPRHTAYLTTYLRGAREMDLYRYLVTVMITSPKSDVRQLLAEVVYDEQNSARIEVLREALALAPDSPETARLRTRFDRFT